MTVLVCVIAAIMILVGINAFVAIGFALVLIWPPAAIAMIVGAIVWEFLGRRRNHRDESETAFLTSVASAVSSGSNVRDAIAQSRSPLVDDSTQRLCHLGRPMVEVANALAPRMPATGRELGVLLTLSEDVGSSIVPALHQLAEDAGDVEQRKRDQRVAVAQAKLSAVVVGVVPLVVASAVVLVRGIPEPGGALIVVPMVLGALMMIAGSAVVVVVGNRIVA